MLPDYLHSDRCVDRFSIGHRLAYNPSISFSGPPAHLEISTVIFIADYSTGRVGSWSRFCSKSTTYPLISLGDACFGVCRILAMCSVCAAINLVLWPRQHEVPQFDLSVRWAMAVVQYPMKLLAILLSFAATFCTGAVHPEIRRTDGLTCTIGSLGHGHDDAPRFASTVKSPFCQTIEIPEHTTLNISTKMDLTGLKNKHIVGPFRYRNRNSLD